jgi:hypothetical protein
MHGAPQGGSDRLLNIPVHLLVLIIDTGQSKYGNPKKQYQHGEYKRTCNIFQARTGNVHEHLCPAL